MDNMVINLGNTQKVRFTYKVLEIVDEYGLYKHYLFLVVRNENNSAFMLSGFSEFFLKNCLNQARNTLIRKAKLIVAFLNYVLIDNSNIFGVKTIKDITIEIGNEFLNEYANGKVCGKYKKQKSTIKLAEHMLTQFYNFLYKRGNMKHLKSSDFKFVKVKVSFGGRIKETTVLKNLFLIDYPNVIAKDILHNVKPILIIELIKFVREVMPEIALAVALQIFGGFRASEICNITYGIIDTARPVLKGKEFSWITIDLRYPKKIREDDVYVGGIKRPRVQPVHPAGMKIVSDLFELHRRIVPRDNFSDAVFLNKNGNPMTYHVFNSKFKAIKKKFIDYLSNHESSLLVGQANFLNVNRWGLHLFRGVFSNMVASEAKTPQEIAYWRGDKSLDASITYLEDTERTTSRIESMLYCINNIDD